MPLSPPDSDHFPACDALRGLTIPRDMDRSQMLRECQCRERHLHPRVNLPSNMGPIIFKHHKDILGTPHHALFSSSLPATRDGFTSTTTLCCRLYTRKPKDNAANPPSDGRMKLQTARLLDKTLEAKYSQACATQSHDSRRPSLCASHLPPAGSRLPEARYTRVLRSTRKLPK